MSAIVDITERKRAEEQIRHLAVTDPLTGLANYRRLLEVLDSEIKRHGRTGRSFAVLLLDLKKINDAHGQWETARSAGWQPFSGFNAAQLIPRPDTEGTNSCSFSLKPSPLRLSRLRSASLSK